MKTMLKRQALTAASDRKIPETAEKSPPRWTSALCAALLATSAACGEVPDADSYRDEFDRSEEAGQGGQPNDQGAGSQGAGGGDIQLPGVDSDVTTWALNVPPGEACPNGGVTVIAGIDLNGSGTYDLGDESVSEETVCVSDVDPDQDRTQQMIVEASVALEAGHSLLAVAASLQLYFEANPGEVLDILLQLTDDAAGVVTCVHTLFDVSLTAIAELLCTLEHDPFTKGQLAVLFGVDLGLSVEALAELLIEVHASLQASAEIVFAEADLTAVISLLTEILHDDDCVGFIASGDINLFVEHFISVIGEGSDITLKACQFLFDLPLTDCVATVVNLGFETATWAVEILKNAGSVAAEVAAFLVAKLHMDVDASCEVLRGAFGLSIEAAVKLFFDLKLASVDVACEILKNAGVAAAQVAQFAVSVLGQSAEAACAILRGLYNMSLHDAVKLLVDIKIASAQVACQILKNAGVAAAQVAQFAISVLGQSAEAACGILRGLYNMSLHDAVKLLVDIKLASVQVACQILKNAGVTAAEIAKFVVNVLGQGVDVALSICRGLFNMSLHDAVRMLVDLGLGSVTWAAKVLGGVFF